MAIHHQQRSALRAIYALSLPPKYIRMLGGLSSIRSECRGGAQGLMWGARGPFLPAAAMIVTVVTLVVFCAKATNKNTKSSCLLAKKLFITVYCKNIVIHVSLIVAWPKQEL